MERDIREVCKEALLILQDRRIERRMIPPALIEGYFREIMTLLDDMEDDGK